MIWAPSPWERKYPPETIPLPVRREGKLDDLGMADDTIIIVTSDHGDLSGDHWCWGKGRYWFDGSLKIPFVIAGGHGKQLDGGPILAGTKYDAPAEEIDTFTTNTANMVSYTILAAIQTRYTTAGMIRHTHR